MKHVYSVMQDTRIQKAFFALHYACIAPVYKSQQYLLLQAEFQCANIYTAVRVYPT
jgi:hypothetical protein